MSNIIQLICPACRDGLTSRGNSLLCCRCRKEYPIKEGVISFLEDSDAFYEGAYLATTNITFPNDRTSLKARLFFDVYRDPYFRALREVIQPGQRILDLGCGGGIRYLAQKGDVTGVDLSFSSLRKVTNFYRMAIQANALRMPFPDNSFDVVTSAYNFEHFRPEDKDFLLGQLYLVLKPAGKLVFLFDCDSNNALFKYFKRNPRLYEQSIIENDQHIGLELASHNIERFRKAGFSVTKCTGLNKTVFQYLPVYGWLKIYGEGSPFISFVVKVASLVSKFKQTWVPYHASVSWLDDLIGKKLPMDDSRLLLVIAEKAQGV